MANVQAGKQGHPDCHVEPMILSIRVLGTEWSPAPRTEGLTTAPDTFPLPLLYPCPQLANCLPLQPWSWVTRRV